VIADDAIPGRAIPNGRATFALIWKTVTSPVDNDDPADRTSEPTALTQPGGSVLRVVDLPPGSKSPLHRTNSLDYGIVISGAVDLELDDGAIASLNAGDIVVQRGTIHAWINRGATTARMAFVLLDATPATAGGRELAPVMHEIAPED
jgi:quercetin dioxygenase-like cupin family protein